MYSGSRLLRTEPLSVIRRLSSFSEADPLSHRSHALSSRGRSSWRRSPFRYGGDLSECLLLSFLLQLGGSSPGDTLLVRASGLVPRCNVRIQLKILRQREKAGSYLLVADARELGDINVRETRLIDRCFIGHCLCAKCNWSRALFIQLVRPGTAPRWAYHVVDTMA